MEMEFTENLSNDDNGIVQQSATKAVTATSKRCKRSLVWKDFTEVDVSNRTNKRERAKCNHCDKEFFSESTLGTSNLKRHLNSCSKRPSQLVGGYGMEVDQGVYREKLAMAIMRHGYPFTWIEHEGNRDVHSFLNETAKPISRNTIKAECLKLHHQIKEKLKGELRGVSSRICLTSDLWTSCTTKGYLCLTAHYIDDDWELKSKILNFCHAPPPHTANNLFQSICSLLKEWGIDKKIFTITLDNASNNGCMQEMLREELTSLLCGGEFFHIHCCAHILNLIVQDGIKELGDSVTKIRDSVKYVGGSEGRKLKFEDSIKFCGITSSKGLWLDVPTRWNSTFQMLERAILYRRAFANLARTDLNYSDYPSNEEWGRVEEICTILRPFYEITNLFSGTHYPTANLYFLSVWRIQLRIREATRSSSSVIQRMAKRMEGKFSKYWEDYSPILSLAVVLDPRFKLTIVKYCYKELGDEYENKWVHTRDQLTKLFKEYSWAKKRNTTKVTECESVFAEQRHADIDAFNDFDENLDSNKSQLDMYLEEPRLDHKKDLDVLKYWKEKQNRYPELAAMARDVLSIPITTVASESTFSMGGRVLNKWRSSLLPENAEALITTRNWIYGYECYAGDTEDGTKLFGEELSFAGLSESLPIDSEFGSSIASNHGA